jgi:endonuclease III
VSADEDTARAVIARHGTTYAAAAGIRLTHEPAPLFQLLVLAELLSARIGAEIAVAAAGELLAHGGTTPQHMREAPRSGVIRALGRAGYRRYDERTATQLREMAQLVLDRYGGDLRRLAEEARGDVGAAARLLQEVKGIGPTGAAVFLREVQAVWPWVRPYLDDRARAGARRIGLPDDAERLAELVADDELAPFAAGLVRISLLPRRVDPLARDGPDTDDAADAADTDDAAESDESNHTDETDED